MDPLIDPLPPPPPITTTDYAIQALAEAMAERAEPVHRLPPTEAIFIRAAEIVRGLLDISGRPFAVLVADCEADARRLMEVSGLDGEDGLGDALLIIKRLTV